MNNENKEVKQSKKKKWHLYPLILSLIIFLLDQGTKLLVLQRVKIKGTPLLQSFFNGLINIKLVFNTGAAFSLGSNFNEILRFVLLAVLPLVALIALLVFVIQAKQLKNLERWFLAGILGGGFGNITDRIIRKEGVVDFLDVKFFGLFGMERWPTFNLADSAIVICCIGLIITWIVYSRKERAITKEN